MQKQNNNHVFLFLQFSFTVPSPLQTSKTRRCRGKASLQDEEEKSAFLWGVPLFLPFTTLWTLMVKNCKTHNSPPALSHLGMNLSLSCNASKAWCHAVPLFLPFTPLWTLVVRNCKMHNSPPAPSHLGMNLSLSCNASNAWCHAFLQHFVKLLCLLL